MELILGSPEATSFLGISEDGKAVALLELSLRNFVDGCLGGPVGYIEGVYLDPTMRGRGLGRDLVRFAADWFRGRGCRDMAADAEIENRSSQEFLRSVGFAETYRIVEFKKSLERR